MTSVVIAAGGTGGHLVPALAIADALARAEPTVSISFIGAGRALESELLRGYPVATTGMRPFSRTLRGVVAPLSLIPATSRARAILRERHADVVVGMGGYASIPAVAAARLLKVPSVIHEQNVVPGLANEVCALLTPNIAVASPDAVRAFRRRHPRVVGMPLRREIADIDRRAAREAALATFGLDRARPTILVVGGSLGARALNDAVSGLIDDASSDAPPQILWSAGSAAAAGLSDRFRDRRGVHIYPFIEQMDRAYAAATVVVCRGGASTVAELAVAGVPAVVVPYPHARRKEQHANARALAAAGAAVVVDESALTPARLGAIVTELLNDAPRLARMAEAASALATPDAAEAMAAWALALAREAA